MTFLQKLTDGSEMFDASDYVYEFIQCTNPAPVKLSKAGLCYNSTTNVIENRIRDWLGGGTCDQFPVSCI